MRAQHPWRQTSSRLWIVIRVCGLLLALRLLLPCLKLQTLLKWLTPPESFGGAQPLELEQAVWWTDSFLRFVFSWQGKCLPRTLTLYYVATRSGYPVQMHCGIRRDGNELQGHAWLSQHGVPFLEQDDPVQHYVSVFSLPYPERTANTTRLDAAALNQHLSPLWLLHISHVEQKSSEDSG